MSGYKKQKRWMPKERRHPSWDNITTHEKGGKSSLCLSIKFLDHVSYHQSKPSNFDMHPLAYQNLIETFHIP